VEPDVFFEGLVLSVKNEVLSKQATLFKIKKHRKRVLTDRIWSLRENMVDNHVEIFRLEQLLNDIVESELRLELKNFSKFERLNNEKITPYFMKLAQADNSNNTGLDAICDDTGTQFGNPAELGTYITDFYEKLYSKPIGPEQNGDSVTNFLSDVLDYPAVNDSKLSVKERDELDLDLEISEFDAAIKKTKTNTSPGIDGISNRFIKKFWHLFRVPLFNYSVYCLNRGSLTENFRIAKVRLIPKKKLPEKNFKLEANQLVKLLL
jgi:hypothetical protein